MYEGDNSLQIPAATELFEHVSQPLNPSIFSTKVLIMQYSESVAAGDELLFEFGELVDLFEGEEAGGEDPLADVALELAQLLGYRLPDELLQGGPFAGQQVVLGQGFPAEDRKELADQSRSQGHLGRGLLHSLQLDELLHVDQSQRIQKRLLSRVDRRHQTTLGFVCCMVWLLHKGRLGRS
jgi:hypothetical protein